MTCWQANPWFRTKIKKSHSQSPWLQFGCLSYLLLLETKTSPFHSSPRLQIPNYFFPLCKWAGTAPPLVNSIICAKKQFSTHSRRFNCFHCLTSTSVLEWQYFLQFSRNYFLCFLFMTISMASNTTYPSGRSHSLPWSSLSSTYSSKSVSRKSVGSAASLQRACQSVCPSWYPASQFISLQLLPLQLSAWTRAKLTLIKAPSSYSQSHREAPGNC